MSVLEWRKNDAHYISVNRYFLEDKRLTFKARGLLGYLATKPDGWKINFRHLGSKKVGPDGEFAVRTALRELEAKGYLKRHRVKGKDGKWAGWHHELWDYPKYRRVAINAMRETATVSESKTSSSKERSSYRGHCENCGGRGPSCWCD